MNPNATEHDTHLTRRAYTLLAGVAAIIGLACSAITSRFFIIGLERTESDSLACEALIAAGVLMIIVEVAAFGLAALLPRQKLRELRLRLVLTGLLLVAFECVTIYSTQYLLVRGADAHSRGEDSKIRGKEQTLAGMREEVATLRAKAARESVSPYPWIRQGSTATLAQAAAKETEIAAETAELAEMQAKRLPTLTDALGESGVLVYSAARALLVSVVGLVMIGASGALLRAGRAVTPVAVRETPAEPPEPVTPPRPGYAHGIQVAPAGLPAALPLTSSARRWLAAGVQLAAVPAAFAAPTVTVAAPVTADTETPSAATVPTVMESAVTPDAATAQAVTTAPVMQEDTATNSTVTEPAATPKPARARTAPVPTATTRVRYERIRAGIEAGTIKPSVRAVQAAEGGGTAEVRACLQGLERDGILVRAGQGWALLRPPLDANQMNLIGDAA